jgi:plasmid stabilization system protein ParE
MKDEKREQLRKFIQLCIDQDLAADGEDAIEKWTEMVEGDSNLQFYRLDDAAKQQIRDIAAEYWEARRQEEAERERRRLAEEKADEIMANHYAGKIRNIVLERMDKRWLPKPKPNAATRRRPRKPTGYN